MKLSTKILKEMIKEEYIRILKEENEEIKAQNACQGAIFRVKKALEGLYKDLQSAGLITSYKITTKVYNTGYEIRERTERMPYEELMAISDLSSEAEDLTNFIYNGAQCFIHPETFFQSNFEEKGQAKFEAQIIVWKPKGTAEKYPSINAIGKNGIKKATEEFVNYNLDSINKVKKTLAIVKKQMKESGK